MASGIRNLFGNKQQSGGSKTTPHPANAYSRPPEADDEEGVLAFVEDQIDRSRRRDYPWHAMYYLSAANVVGRQWATFNPRSRALEEPRVPSNRVLLTLNQILPMVLRESSKLSLGRIPWTVVPTSQDEESLSSARMDGKLLEHFWEVNGMRRVEANMNLTRTMWGMCWYEADYDNTLGKLLDRGNTGEDGGERRIPEYEGGVTVRLLTPFEVMQDPDATDVDELRWIAYTKMMDVGKLRQMYERGDEVVPEQPDEQTYLQYRMQYLSSHYFQAFTTRGDYDRFPNHAKFTKYWYYPDDKYPEGREIHKAGNVVLYDGPWRHKFLTESRTRKHPLIPTYYTKIPLRFRGQGMVENLLEPQWEYNKKRSQMVTILNRMAKPKWLAAKGHRFNHAPNDEAGEFLEYTVDMLNPTGKPEAILPNLPTGDFEATMARTMADMQNTASQHEVSYGRTPPGVSAGVAIEQLIAQDDAAKGLPLHDSLAALQDLGHSILGLYRQYGAEEEVISLAGRNYMHEFFSWKKSASDPYARVHIISDGSLPMTRGQRREAVKELVGLGLVDPMEKRNAVLQALQYGDLEDLFQEMDQDLMAAKRENREMLDTDTLPEVQPEDDHEVHIVEHTNAIKSRRELDPVAQGRIRTHMFMHLHFKGKIQMQNAELMAEGAGSMDELANRSGDDVGRKMPNEGVPVKDGEQPEPTDPASGNQGRKKTSGTPGNEQRAKKRQENQ